MIYIDYTEVYGFGGAITGMRNPMNSWENMDTEFDQVRDKCNAVVVKKMGENDLALMKKLALAGSDHAKYRRMITVYADICAPLYWWKEFDTYKIGTVANSCSTMHKIHEKEFTLDDFSTEHLLDESITALHTIIDELNLWRNKYLIASKIDDIVGTELVPSKKTIWWQMIQLLPSSYNQLRTVMLNYEVLSRIYFARRNHKLDEWHDFCKWIESLPYASDIIFPTKEETDA
jgi:hypothetical protein